MGQRPRCTGPWNLVSHSWRCNVRVIRVPCLSLAHLCPPCPCPLLLAALLLCCRALFALAHKLSPSVIFVDEIDSFLSKRGQSNSEHEALRKMKNEVGSRLCVHVPPLSAAVFLLLTNEVGVAV